MKDSVGNKMCPLRTGCVKKIGSPHGTFQHHEHANIVDVCFCSREKKWAFARKEWGLMRKP